MRKTAKRPLDRDMDGDMIKIMCVKRDEQKGRETEVHTDSEGVGDSQV